MNLSVVPITDANNILLAKPFILTEERLIVLRLFPATECPQKHLLTTFVVPSKGCINMTAPLLCTPVLDLCQVDVAHLAAITFFTLF